MTACGNDNIANGMQYEFPECGTSQLNGKYIKKVCATRDSIANKVSKDYTPKFLQILVGAGHTSNYSGGRESLVLDLEDQELDLQGHAWDFSKQHNPGLIFEGHDIIIRNGIILNRENIFIKNIKNKANSFSLHSWSGGVLNSQLVLKNRLNIYGSKAIFIKNKIISDAEFRI